MKNKKSKKIVPFLWQKLDSDCVLYIFGFVPGIAFIENVYIS